MSLAVALWLVLSAVAAFAAVSLAVAARALWQCRSGVALRHRQPNGKPLYAFNQAEADLLHHEMYVDRVHLSNGVALRDGDVVLDVGGNTGSFAVFLARESGLELDVHSFEPVPDVADALELNAAMLCEEEEEEEEANTPPCRVHVNRFGLSDRDETVEFEFSRAMSVGSSRYPITELGDKYGDKTMSLGAAVAELNTFFRRVGLGLRPLSDFAVRHADSGALPARLAGTVAGVACMVGVEIARRAYNKRVTCRLRRAGDVLAEVLGRTTPAGREVGLLKIDVEGAEMDVMRGLTDNDVRRCRQVVIEVHGAQPLADLRERLERLGFSVVTSDVFSSMGIFALYAIRNQ